MDPTNRNLNSGAANANLVLPLCIAASQPNKHAAIARKQFLGIAVNILKLTIRDTSADIDPEILKIIDNVTCGTKADFSIYSVKVALARKKYRHDSVEDDICEMLLLLLNSAYDKNGPYSSLSIFTDRAASTICKVKDLCWEEQQRDIRIAIRRMLPKLPEDPG